MTETPPPSPLAAEGEPTWLNPATIKGAILIALGMLFLNRRRPHREASDE